MLSMLSDTMSRLGAKLYFAFTPKTDRGHSLAQDREIALKTS